MLAKLAFRSVLSAKDKPSLLKLSQNLALHSIQKPVIAKMSTFILKGYDVPVTLPDDLTQEELTSFIYFNNWVKTLTNSLSLQAKDPSHPFHADPYTLKSITVQSYDAFGCPPNSRIGFLKLKADVSNSDNGLPGSVFLRGPAVAMLVILVPDDAPEGSDERYVLLTVQPRIPAGSMAFVELPAGMVDEEGEFAGTAAREIKEEIGMEIRAHELVCLSELAMEGQGENEEGLPLSMFPSVGGCDEHIKIYMHEKRIPREQLKEWSGKLTGLRDEGERITLKLVKMQDLWKEGARDAKALAAVALWENLRRDGKL